ncbi:Uncharacterised protein [uncultured archaeon]|nr:Uncharacterised protein [uncultured archaeon]
MASRKPHTRRRISGSKQNQLIGILLLFLTFAALCYIIMSATNDGTIKLPFGQENQTPEELNTSSMTTISVVYTNSGNSVQR